MKRQLKNIQPDMGGKGWARLKKAKKKERKNSSTYMTTGKTIALTRRTPH